MEVNKLNKTLPEIFGSKYIVPLYQRNFAWSVDEISQLLQDVYESYKANKGSNYYIGSLVVLRRRNGDFEIIDGQQRLTVISLILKILNVDFLKEPKLFYDSRPEVEAFFSSFYQTGKTNDVTFDHKVSHLIHAVDIIKESNINPNEKEHKTILSINDIADFRDYLRDKVILVRVEIPQDTDVASYFEIMNNRGEQLQKHEILKARLMDKIKGADGKHDLINQEKFSKIWDACSQMDVPIQKLFNTTDRRNLFGDDYASFSLTEDYFQTIETIEANKNSSKFTIDDILTENSIHAKNPSKIVDVDDESEDKSIIDFPNFIMHIFKLEFNEAYQLIIASDEKNREIPLNEKDLLCIFKLISDIIDPLKFIIKLLYYRTVFDKYIVKASEDEKSDDNFKWSLEKPYKYVYEKRNNTSLKYKPTFENNDQIVKSLSLMQVTFRNRKYKNWLQDILKWFSDRTRFSVEKDSYQKFLDTWIFNFYENNFSVDFYEKPYNEGTRTPHFLFNFIDYLYWVDSTKDESKNFEFKYRNSIEHHLPQSFRNEINKDWIDNLGNLCLLSKNSNSKMNNEEPKGKAATTGKYYKKSLPPKQRVMYDLTNQRNTWSINEIQEHNMDVIKLIQRAKEVLQIN